MKISYSLNIIILNFKWYVMILGEFSMPSTAFYDEPVTWLDCLRVRKN